MNSTTYIIIGVVLGISAVMMLVIVILMNSRKKKMNQFFNEGLKDHVIVKIYGGKNIIIDGLDLNTQIKSTKGMYGERIVLLTPGKHCIEGRFEVYGQTLSKAKAFMTKKLSLNFEIALDNQYDILTGKYPEDFICYTQTNIEVREGLTNNKHYLGLRYTVEE